MPSAYLSERGVVRIAGAEARAFLERLLTSDIDSVSPDQARHAALLTPQGKIIVDMIVTQAPAEDGAAFFLDTPRALAPDLVKRLILYKLRAKIDINDVSDDLGVAAVWAEPAPSSEDALVYADPRLSQMGHRMIGPRNELDALGDGAAYHTHRIALGVPEGGQDYIFSDTFPHEALMDQLNGVDFRKGCYVGQEVVSRMEHRGSARSRIVPVVFDAGIVPVDGMDALAGDRVIGRIGSCANGRGLALLRLDKVADTLREGIALSAGGLTFHLEKPDYARFAFPDETGFPGKATQATPAA
jgi:tRNA-modifying protein YgfZ